MKKEKDAINMGKRKEKELSTEPKLTNTSPNFGIPGPKQNLVSLDIRIIYISTYTLVNI